MSETSPNHKWILCGQLLDLDDDDERLAIIEAVLSGRVCMYHGKEYRRKWEVQEGQTHCIDANSASPEPPCQPCTTLKDTSTTCIAEPCPECGRNTHGFQVFDCDKCHGTGVAQ